MKMNNARFVFVPLLSLLVGASTVCAQYEEPYEPDPAAAKAFRQVLEAYRQRPALRVESALSIELTQGDAIASSENVTAEFTYSRDGAGRVKIKQFICAFRDGVFRAIREETGHSYYEEEYAGSPYWVLLSDFLDIPYPHLALLWGEPAPDEVWMQLHPQTPLIVPTAVEDVQRKDGKRQRLTFSSPNATMHLLIDPKTKLIESIDHEITGGTFVPPGAVKRTTYTFKYATFDEPLPDEEMKLDLTGRQRVSVLASLSPPPEVAPPGQAPPAGQPAVAAQAGGLVGKPAPPFVLATADGGAVDLAELRGRVVVLDFWATWCGPCISALPKLHEVAQWVREEALPVEILTVNVWEQAESPDARLDKALTFWKEHNFTLPIAMDYTDETATAYGVTGIPATFIIRADGIVHARHAGFGGDYAQSLKQDIRAALSALEEPDADE
jgi:thiol-disulfide isomerase/thioredoxin